jgi:hypothetical protein
VAMPVAQNRRDSGPTSAYRSEYRNTNRIASIPVNTQLTRGTACAPHSCTSTDFWYLAISINTSQFSGYRIENPSSVSSNLTEGAKKGQLE